MRGSHLEDATATQRLESHLCQNITTFIEEFSSQGVTGTLLAYENIYLDNDFPNAVLFIF